MSSKLHFVQSFPPFFFFFKKKKVTCNTSSTAMNERTEQVCLVSCMPQKSFYLLVFLPHHSGILLPCRTGDPFFACWHICPQKWRSWRQVLASSGSAQPLEPYSWVPSGVSLSTISFLLVQCSCGLSVLLLLLRNLIWDLAKFLEI